MSHHTHIFLCNEQTADEAMSYVNSLLDENIIYAHNIDYYEIIGAADLSTGEFTQNKYTSLEYEDEPTTIEKLEEYANSLFSKKRYDELQERLKIHLLNKHFWNAARICEKLDGIVLAVNNNLKWTVKDPFPINNWYLQFEGITDVQNIIDPTIPTGLYAVLVDFHS